MNCRVNRGRRGITLTEILIGILILGVGMPSLMTLFVYGMVNARAATRYSRSRFLAQSAFADTRARNLLTKRSFYDNPATAPWYTKPIAVRTYDPWVQDTPAYGDDPWLAPYGVYRGDGPPASPPFNNPIGTLPGYGFPVAYDPLWRSATGFYPDPKTTPEYRFGSGIGFVRNDPDGTPPSAHGLQRITNFPAWTTANVPDIFVSPDDMVFPSATDASKGAGTFSTIVPDMKIGGPNTGTGMDAVANDWKYTWMFTGHQSSAADDRYDGDMVIFENRPFGAEPATPPIATTPAVTQAVTGETVVEAIFGYTGKVTSVDGKIGYGSTANRVVLLRWSDKVVDPEIRAGGWFADVTYERNATRERQRAVADPVAGGLNTLYPYQRCHWYQIAKRTQATASTMPGYREMTVWTTNPLYSFTLLNVSDGSPVHVNAALVSPHVINVYPRSIYAR